MQPLLKTGKINKARADMLSQQLLSEENLLAFTRYRELFQLKGYKSQTLRTYCSEFQLILRLLGKLKVCELTKEKVQGYLLWLQNKRRYSATHLHTTINSLKFYFEQAFGRGCELNLKHRALLMTAYSAGLRVRELVSLKIKDKDPLRMIIQIHEGKGGKDRMMPLSQTLQETLRAYYKQYQLKNISLKDKMGPYTVPELHRKY